MKGRKGKVRVPEILYSARMYFLVDNHDFGRHALRLSYSASVAAFAFIDPNCVDAVASAFHVAALTQS